MSTVRIYKVAELLGMSSQDAMTLLKQDTGIDVKSASSSIEEIVARQFVERHARKRNITLPNGPLFADTPATKKGGGKSKAAPEPPRPAAVTLRPRLVKTIRPAAPAEPAADIEGAPAVETPAAAADFIPAAPAAAAPSPAEPAAAPVMEAPRICGRVGSAASPGRRSGRGNSGPAPGGATGGAAARARRPAAPGRAARTADPAPAHRRSAYRRSPGGATDPRAAGRPAAAVATGADPSGPAAE